MPMEAPIRTASLFTLLGFAVGCGSPRTVPSDDTDEIGTPTLATCDITTTNANPPDGQTEVYYRHGLSWEFSERDDSVEVTLTRADGAEVQGTGEWIDETFLWTPDEPLTPDASFNWTLTFCEGEQTHTGMFSTSVVGAEVDLADLEGALFYVDFYSGNFVQPPGLGALLQTQFATSGLLVGVVSIDGANLELATATPVDAPGAPVQDLCQPTDPFPFADFAENPYMELGPQDTTLQVQGAPLEIVDFFVSGSFRLDGSAIDGVVFAGLIDTRTLVPAGAPPGQICDQAQTFGITCTSCPAGGDFCLEVLVTDLVGDRLPGETLVPRDAATIAADPSCP